MNPDGGLAWNASNDQMMPGGTQIQESRSTQVGKYGGSPLFASTGQILPHAHWANQLQGNRLAREKQRAEIRQKLEKWDPLGGIPEVAPAYQESLNNYVAAGFEDVYKAALDLNGGDEQQAQLAMMNPGSPEGRALADFRNAATVVARKANFVTNDALAAMKAMDEGEAEYNQEVYDAADAAIRALNNGGNVRAVADSLEQYETVKEWNSFLKDTGLQQALKDAAFGKDVLVPGRRDNLGNNLYDTLTVADPAQRDQILDLYAAQVPPKYHKMWGTDGVKERLSAYLTMNEEAKRQIDEPWHGFAPSSSGSGAGGDGRPFTVGVSKSKTEQRPGVLRKGAQDTIVMDLFDNTGDKTMQMGNRTLRVGTEDKDLYGIQVQYNPDNNRWEIHGRDLSNKEKDELTAKFGDDETAKSEWAISHSIGTPVTTTFSDNASRMEGYTKGFRSGDQMLAAALSGRGIQATEEEVKEALMDPIARKELMKLLQ